MEFWMVLSVALTLAVIFVNGWTDAPNAIATVVSTGGLVHRQAALLASICNFLGVFIMAGISPAVAYSIGSVIDLSSTGGNAQEGGMLPLFYFLCASLAAILIWSMGAWIFGIPTSESHSLVAALTGAALAFGGSGSVIRWDVWRSIVIGMVGSVVLGFSLAYLVELSHPRAPGKVRAVQILTAMALAFLHGAQDGQKFLGILLLVVHRRGGAPWKLVLLCGLAMALGTLTGGRRIVEKIGSELVELSPKQGISADGTAVACLLGASLLGFPVSTTHVKIAAAVGVGVCSGCGISRKVVKELAMTWVMTFPGCMALGFVLMRWFMVY